MHHGVLAQGRQIERRFSHVEWIDLLAAENLLRRRIHEFVGHAAGTDGAYFNVMRTAFVGQRFRQRQDAVLRCAVGARAGPGLHAGDARHVDDDPPALLLHLLESGPTTEEGAAQIHVHHLIERLRRCLGEPPSRYDTRVVHKNIQPSIALHRLINQSFHLALIGHVGLNGPCLTAALRDLRDGLLAERHPSGRDDDLRAFGSEPQRNRLADAAAAARYNRHFIFQPVHVFTL